MEMNKEKELEVVESEVVEQVTPEVIEEPVPEEVEVVEYEIDATIEEETYVEYFKKVAFKQQLKPTIFFGVAIVLLSYFFRGEKAATEALLSGLLWGLVFVVVSIGVSFFTMGSRAKQTYNKSGLHGLVLKTQFTNVGIKQSIEDQSVTYKWGDIDNFQVSEISYFGNMPKLRRILLMSKKNMSEENINRINEIIKEHLGENKLVSLDKK